MINRILLTLLFLCLAFRAEAGMVRVLEVVNGRTIVIDRAGSRATVILAGVTLIDEASARNLLEWTLASAWVMLEERPGGAFVYRSPDALFLNRELVLRGFATATLPGVEPEQRVPVTYLGQLRPSGAPPAVEAPAAPKRRSGTGTRRRSPAGPSRPARRGGS